MFKNLTIKDEKIEGINKMNKKMIINKTMYLMILILFIFIAYLFEIHTLFQIITIFLFVLVFFLSDQWHWIPKLIKKTQRVTFYPKRVIRIDSNIDGGPFVFFDLGDGEYLFIDSMEFQDFYRLYVNDGITSIVDESNYNPRITEGNILLGQMLNEGKNIIKAIKVEIILGRFFFSKDNKPFFVLINTDDSNDKTIEFYHIRHGYEQKNDCYDNAVPGNRNIILFKNNKIDYGALPNNTFALRPDGEEFYPGFWKHVLNGEKTMNF